MKFVALLSGGKDSCFNVIKCVEHGHELVCLANLSPPQSFEGEEMDSFMYQTAGHTAIAQLSECFEVPLIRREILGSAVNQKLDYLNEVEADEVEDMFVLLRDVKQQFPDVEGVSCGAIVSTYQRLRVESICQRLGLTVLSYLWQRDRVELLQEMISAGVDAVLVKVAGAGLEPHKHLGKSLAFLQPTLMRLHQQFGLDVCGEGGEYESLVLDCSVFKKRLVLHETEVLIDEENYTVGNLRIKRCSCVAKEEGSAVAAASANEDLALLQRIDHTIRNVQHSVKESLLADTVVLPSSEKVIESILEGEKKASRKELSGRVQALPRLSIGSDGYGQTSLMYPLFPSSPASSSPLSTDQAVQAQLSNMMQRLQAALRTVGASMADIVFVHLYISSNAVFKAVNDEYCKWFGHYPPSRSCVCVPLLGGVHVVMDACFLKDSHASLLCEGRSTRRNVLHVKSMSEWAPLCIGPYAQANVINRSIIFVAGQIPLNPANMKLFDPADGLKSLSGSLRRILSDLSRGLAPAAAEVRNLGSSVHSVQSQSELENSSFGSAEVSTVAANVFVQVVLCLRHAHRVLQVLTSSLSRTLSCTVYVNTTALLALGAALDVNASGIAGSSPSSGKKAVLDEEQLRVFVRKVLWQMDRADCAVRLGGKKGQNGGEEGEGEEEDIENEYDDDEEDDESFQQQDDEYPASKLYPVLVVGTSGLPRDALVEVEIAAFAHNTIPAEAFLHRESTSLSSDAQRCAEVCDAVKKTDESLTAQIDAWPIWSAPSMSQSGLLTGRENAVEDAVVRYCAQSQFTSLSRNLCTGFVSVQARKESEGENNEFGTELTVLDSAAEGADAPSDLFLDVDEAAELLVHELCAMLAKAKVHSVFLRTLRVYYVAGTVSAEQLSGAVAAQLCAMLGLKKFPLVLVPLQTLDLSLSSHRTVLAAQVSAFDLAQIDTEEWVHVKE